MPDAAAARPSRSQLRKRGERKALANALGQIFEPDLWPRSAHLVGNAQACKTFAMQKG
jgi:hypothetical protein